MAALLGVLLAGPAIAGPELLVVSRHSGEVLSGAEFNVPDLPQSRRLATQMGSAGPSAVALVQAARLEAEAHPLDRRAAGELVLEVDRDRVLLRTRSAEVPPIRREDGPAEVQVFGLVGSSQVTVRCPGRAVRVIAGGLEEIGPGWNRLSDALGRGSLLCGGGPWQVRVAGSAARPYAGVFTFRPLPDRQPEPGTTPREARARRGSEVIFRTTLSAYVAGVLAAEEARLDGEPALALAQVIAHDARVERHPGRPLCDTTHCQSFLGTATATAEVTRALALPDLPTTRWLPYSRGGEEPWAVRRPAAEVRAVVGDAVRIAGNGRTLDIVRGSGVEHRSCEPVRASLRLPSCPTEGVFQGETVRFRGRGRGHGIGLDVEAARRSGLSASELLRRAYGL